MLVLGIGNSATDIAVESSRVAERTYLAMRRGAHIVPKYVFGVPTDHLTDGPVGPDAAPGAADRDGRTAAADPGASSPTTACPSPTTAVLHAHPTVSDDLLTRLGHGDITVLPTVDRFEGAKVFFVDGSAREVDVVVYCTGYKVTFPFLDERVVRATDNHVDLYRRVVDPDHPGLYFVGLIQPLGAIMPLAEAQAQWVADLVTGEGGAAVVRRDAPADPDLRRGRAERLRRVEAAHHPGRLPQVPGRDRPRAAHRAGPRHCAAGVGCWAAPRRSSETEEADQPARDEKRRHTTSSRR